MMLTRAWLPLLHIRRSRSYTLSLVICAIPRSEQGTGCAALQTAQGRFSTWPCNGRSRSPPQRLSCGGGAADRGSHLEDSCVQHHARRDTSLGRLHLQRLVFHQRRPGGAWKLSRRGARGVAGLAYQQCLVCRSISLLQFVLALPTSRLPFRSRTSLSCVPSVVQAARWQRRLLQQPLRSVRPRTSRAAQTRPRCWMGCWLACWEAWPAAGQPLHHSSGNHAARSRSTLRRTLRPSKPPSASSFRLA